MLAWQKLDSILNTWHWRGWTARRPIAIVIDGNDSKIIADTLLQNIHAESVRSHFFGNILYENVPQPLIWKRKISVKLQYEMQKHRNTQIHVKCRRMVSCGPENDFRVPILKIMTETCKQFVYTINCGICLICTAGIFTFKKKTWHFTYNLSKIFLHAE